MRDRAEGRGGREFAFARHKVPSPGPFKKKKKEREKKLPGIKEKEMHFAESRPQVVLLTPLSHSSS